MYHFAAGNRILISAGYFLSFFAIGSVLAGLGPVLSALSLQLDTPTAELGFLFTTRALGYLAGSALGGILVDRLRHTHSILLAGNLACAVGSAALPSLRRAAAVALAAVTHGVCMGVLDTAGNVLLLRLHGPSRVEPYMQAMHFCFGLGAFLSPLVVEAAVRIGDGGAGAFYVFSVALVAACVPLLPFRGPSAWGAHGESGAAEQQQQSSAPAMGTRSPPLLVMACCRRFATARNCFLVCVSLTLALYVGTEVAFGGLIYSFATDAAGIHETTSRMLNSMFWGAIAAGRLVAIPVSLCISPRTMLTVNVFLMLTAAALFEAAPLSPVAVWLSTVLLGVGMAPVFPSMLSYAERTTPVSGRMATAFVVSAAVGETLVPVSVTAAFGRSPSSFPVFVGALCAAHGVTFAGTVLAARAFASPGAKASAIEQSGEPAAAEPAQAIEPCAPIEDQGLELLERGRQQSTI